MGSTFFHLLKKSLKRGELGHCTDGVKWDSYTYLFTSIDTRNKGNYKQMLIYGIRRSLIVIGSITEVRRRRARFIIGWVTAW